VLVCDKCITSPFLRQTIREEGIPGKCPTCKRRGHRMEAEALREDFGPLSCYYTPVVYGEHYVIDSDTGDTMPGACGGRLAEMILEDWDILDGDVFDSKLADDFLSEAFPDYDRSSQYASEAMFERHAHEQFQLLAERLMHERRFFPEPTDFDTDSMELILDRYLDLFEADLKSHTWYRGRRQPRTIGDATPPVFKADKMGAPPPERVLRGGRANPPGIAYLYLTSSIETAIAEVRAEPGDHVCIAKVRLTNDFKLFNANPPRGCIDPFGIEDLHSVVEQRSLIHEFGQWLSRHVPDETHEVDYLATQYLAEYVLSKGFDGIVYPSAMSKGENLVLFNPEKSKVGKVTQYRVSAMQMTYEFGEAATGY